MGYYINPKDETKETWLEREAIPADKVPTNACEIDGLRPVCLVDNRMFTSAGIAYDDDELRAFLDPADPRDKRWFFAPIEELVKVCPDVARVL